MSIYSPHDESLIAENIQVAGQEDVDAAVAAARAAFKGEWSKWTAQKRSAAMLKLADLIEKHVVELGQWETKAMGMPINIATWVTGYAAAAYRCKSTPDI